MPLNRRRGGWQWPVRQSAAEMRTAVGSARLVLHDGGRDRLTHRRTRDAVGVESFRRAAHLARHRRPGQAGIWGDSPRGESSGVVRVVKACASRESLEFQNQSRDPGGNGNLDITVNRGYRKSEL